MIQWQGLLRRIVYPYVLFWERQGRDVQEALSKMSHGYLTPQEFDELGRIETERIIQPFVREESIIVDYGAGCGRLEPYLAALAKRVYAVEPNRSYLSIGSTYTRSFENVKWVPAGQSTCHLPSGVADCVVGFHFVHHIGRDYAKSVLWEMLRLAKDEGFVLFNVRHGREDEWSLGIFDVEEVLKNLWTKNRFRVKRYRVSYRLPTRRWDSHAGHTFYALTQSKRAFPQIAREVVLRGPCSPHKGA